MKEIKLTRGLVAMVDNADYEWLMQYKWNAHKVRGNNYYAAHGIRTLYMHRLIINPPDGLDIDHIDHNGLNNQRLNLRTCNRSENLANCGLSCNNSTGYKGIKANGSKWQAWLYSNGMETYLGTYPTKELAAYAYDQAAREHFGEFAMTNAMLGLLEA